MEIDTKAELAAVEREVTGTDLRLTRRYAEGPDEVWSALTEADRIGRWLAPVTGDLTLGGRYQVEGNAGGEITDCDPPRSFAATWEFGGHVGRIVVTLGDSEGGGTLLELVHHLPSPPDHWEEFGPGAVGIGWEMGLMGLGLHLADPAAPRPAPEELPDLTGMMRDCGDAWGRAAVDGGADPEWARASADRCVAAYTGA
ncbi:MAG: hypothetical protein QOD98_808 [Nocardioidaceae bacterium]|jgi:uncharacterized protein YndB with AHSA1/START domain|nr:hypothetical protein [Nocardioidaceae bacterium]